MAPFTIATWNINSVRLRINLVRRYLDKVHPDVLCLQETKVQDDKFPLKSLKELGYKHIAIHGQKGYHGVAIAARHPFTHEFKRNFCGKADARHIAVSFENDVTVHNFYVPSGGDVPDPEANEKFAHKLAFLAEMKAWFSKGEEAKRPRQVLVGDLNVAPGEHDVWSHKQMLKVVSHTPVEVAHLEAVLAARDWVDITRQQTPEPEKLYTWWSYRAKDWRASNRGRRLDHIWLTPDLEAAAGPVSIHTEARGWDRPSDHVPVLVPLTV